MAVVRNMLAKLGIVTTEFEQGVDKAKKKHQSLLEQLSKSVGESSALKKWTEILTGAGAAAGVALLAKGIENATKQAVELNNQWTKGEISVSEYRLGIAKSVPLVGSLVGAFENINELITGAKFKKEQFKELEGVFDKIGELGLTAGEQFDRKIKGLLKEINDHINALERRGVKFGPAAYERMTQEEYFRKMGYGEWDLHKMGFEFVTPYKDPEAAKRQGQLSIAQAQLEHEYRFNSPFAKRIQGLLEEAEILRASSDVEKELIKARKEGYTATQLTELHLALETRERAKNNVELDKFVKELDTNRLKAWTDGIQKVNDALDKALKKDKPESWDYLAGLRRELQDLEDQAKGWTPEQIKLNNMRSKMTAAQQREAETLLERIMRFTRKSASAGADRWNSIYGSTPGAIVPLPGGSITLTRTEKELIEQTKILKEIKRDKKGFGA